MGRKIPGKKHRGVRDPEKQQANRLARIRDKINAPPLDPDDQQVSKSLSRIVELKNKVKEGYFNKKKKMNNKSNEDFKNKLKSNFKHKPDKPIPKFERFLGESERRFKNRMNLICNNVIKEAAFEDKYKVNIKHNENGQVIGVEKRPKDELSILLKKARKEKKAKKHTKKSKKEDSQSNDETRLTKSQKWALKKALKKRNKSLQKEEEHSFKPWRETVKFGEVAHAPPVLALPRKVQKPDIPSRPGQKHLHLKTMLTNGTKGNRLPDSKNKDVRTRHLKTKKTIDKKAKRKDLPHAVRRQLDIQQKQIIEAYKTLKSQKLKAR